MDISIFLAQALGLYLIIISLAFTFNQRRFKPIILDMMNAPGLMLISGFMALIIGILLVTSHNIWVMDWRVIITITGWMALLKGLNIIFFPQMLTDLSINWIENKVTYYATFLFTFIMGVIFIYFGYLHP